RVCRLTHEIRGIRCLSRSKLLHAPAIHFRNVEVSFLVHTETVHAPEAAGKVAPDAPRIEEVAVEIVLQHLGSSAIEGPQRAISTDIDKVNIRRLLTGTPFVQVFAVFIEYLYAMICSIINEHSPCLRIDGDAVDVVEVSWPLVIRRISFLTPVEKELAVLIKLRDPRSVVSVRDEQGAVGKPSQESRTIEVRAVSSGHLGSADGLH